MRSALALLLAFLVAGCATPPDTPPDTPQTRAPETAPTTRLIRDRLRLTLDIRYRMGQTLSPETQVLIVNEDAYISTRLKECGMTPAHDYIRYTTGGRIKPGLPCHVLLIPPGEPAQLFDLPMPETDDPLGVWFEWIKPVAQIISPMPVQALINQPKARQPLTVPESRQFEVRHQLTALNSPYDPKAD